MNNDITYKLIHPLIIKKKILDSSTYSLCRILL